MKFRKKDMIAIVSKKGDEFEKISTLIENHQKSKI